MKRSAANLTAAGVAALPLTTVVVLTAGGSAAANCISAPPQQTATGMNELIITTAYAEAMRRGASDRMMQALFEAGLDESSFRNLANPNVPSSLALPNDGRGSDHNSVGYLQQQVGPDGSNAFGWGDVVQAMDPLHASDAFLDAAQRLEASTGGDAADLAQAVQQSATRDGSNYRAFASRAAQLITHQQNAGASPAPSHTGTAPSSVPGESSVVASATSTGVASGIPTSPPGDMSAGGSSCDGGDGIVGPGPATTTTPQGLEITGSAAGVAAVQFALAQLGKPYEYGAAGPDAYDCSGLTMAAWAAGGTTLPHFTGDQVDEGTAEPTNLSRARAGDLVFIPGSDGTPAAPRHVGMVAGTVSDAAGSRLYLVEAPHTGAAVELIEASRWSGIIVDVRRIG